MSPARPPSPQVVRRETLVKGRRFDFEEVELQDGNGDRSVRQHLRHPGAVCVLPILEDSRGRSAVLVRNYRAAVGQWVLEVPAGTLEAGEAPAACAARELVEETGYKAATIRQISRFYTSPGLSDETMWAYVATGLEMVGQNLENDELLTVEELPLAEALKKARGGEIVDAKTVLTLLLADDLGAIGSRAW
jgi:ADP-ribose pyrophosphatase